MFDFQRLLKMSLVLIRWTKSLPVALFIFCHQPPHSFLFNALLLLLLLSLCISMVVHNRLVDASNLGQVIAVILLEIFAMLENCAQIFLKGRTCYYFDYHYFYKECKKCFLKLRGTLLIIKARILLSLHLRKYKIVCLCLVKIIWSSTKIFINHEQ